MTDIREITIAKNVFSRYRPHPFRPYQAEAIQFCVESPKKIVVLEASTGSGKSLIGLTAGSCMHGVTYLVHSKMLQNQITRDFPEAQSLFGRSNYDCLRITGATCEECTSGPAMSCIHHLAYRNEFKKLMGEPKEYAGVSAQPCVYKMRKLEVMMASYRILNYDYFLSEANYIGRFGNQKFVVVDEADSLENTLINFVTLTFTQYALRRIGMDQWASNLKMTSKFKESLIESWVNFGKQALDRINNIIKKLNAECKEMANSLSRDLERKMDELKKVTRLKEKITLFLDNVDDTWMLDNQGDRLIFRPLWLTPELANAFFWRHSKKFVLMSASFYPRPILAKTLGLEVDDMDYYMVPSQFPVKNRPVYIAPAANLTAKTTDVEVPKLIPAIRKIAAARPNVKGIIHAVSYKLAHAIVDSLKDSRFITHNSDDRQQILDKFMASNEPLILVSPSLERGVSLADDLCLAEGTLVRTRSGYIPIDKIKIGDSVWTHKRKFRKVTALSKRKYHGEMVEIKTYGSQIVKITPNHPVLVDDWGKSKSFFDKKTCKWINHPLGRKNKLAWKNAGDITTNDRLLLPIGSNSIKFKAPGFNKFHGKRKNTNPSVRGTWKESEEFWELVGLWAAEGNLSSESIKKSKQSGQPRKHWSVVFSFSKDEKLTLAERCCFLISHVLGNKKPIPYRTASVSRVSIKNDHFAKWLQKNIHCGAQNKIVPSRLIKSGNKKYMLAFLSGYLQGDGSFNGSNITSVSASEQLSLGIRDLALICGYQAGSGSYVSNGKIGNGNIYYKTVISEKTKKGAVNCGQRYFRSHPISVEKIVYSGYVYNLSVEKDESFTLPGICVHNCRLIIIAKAPYLSLGDKVVSARLFSSRIGSDWYKSTMMLTVLQMCGRGVRSATDYAECIILDDQVKQAVTSRPGFMPAWWMDAVEFRAPDLLTNGKG